MIASGRAVVAISTSTTGRPSSALRTAPPTTLVANPAAASAANTARVSPRTSHSASARRGRSAGATAAIALPLLELAGFDASVLHARWGIDLADGAAGRDRCVIGEGGADQQRPGNEQPQQRCRAKHAIGGRSGASRQQHVADVHGGRKQK